MQEELQPLYLYYGEEEYVLENTIKKIKKSFGNLVLGINYIQIEEQNSNKIIQEIETPAFGFAKKMIIVKNTNLFAKVSKNKKEMEKEKIAEYIKNNISNIKESIVLIFIEKEVTKNELYKVIEKDGEIKNFELLKPAQIGTNIKKICNMYKVKISDENVKMMMEITGSNMQNIINELRKLIEYAGENGEVTKEAIEKLTIKQLEYVIFDLTDNLGKRDIKKALEILRQLIYNKEPIQKILITLYNHFKKLYIVHLAKKYNKDIQQSLNLKPNQVYFVGKYKRQADYFKTKELRKILEELINLDYNSKQGKIDLEIGLESILCTYCSWN